MSLHDCVGVLLVISGLVPIYIQVALNVGWITPPRNVEDYVELPGLESRVAEFLTSLLEKAGWMVVVGLILIYFGSRYMEVNLF